MPRVFAVVLNWNRRDDTRACLESLAASTEVPGLVLVDNGSTECAPEELARGLEGRFPAFTLVANPTNLGFARGMNVGLARALALGGEFLWVVNNDVVVDADACRALADALATRPEAAAAGPAVYDARTPGRLSNAGGRVSLKRARTWHLHEGLEAPPELEPHEVDFVEGSAPMLRAKDVEAQGAFDEGYGAYWEDVDWCLAARARGRRVLVAPRARVVHRVSSSSGVHSEYALYHRARNRFRCVRKHGTKTERYASVFGALADLPVDLWHAGRASNGLRAPLAWLRGTVDGVVARDL